MQHVIVSDYGSFLSKTSERLVVKGNKQVLMEIPFFDVEQITITSKGVGLSAEVIRMCAEQGIPITFLSGRGEPYALLSSPSLTATASTRREQYKATEDKRGLSLVKEIIDAKIHNQAALLKYAAKYRKERDIASYTRSMDLAKRIEAHREELKAIQGPMLDKTLRGQLFVHRRTGVPDVLGRLSDAHASSDRFSWPGTSGRGGSDQLLTQLRLRHSL